MRILILASILLAWGADRAVAEERVLADEWTAEFEAGVKHSWAHQRITEGERVGGQRRFILKNRGWTPAAGEVIYEEERVETDSTGRVVSYEHKVTGPLGTYLMTLAKKRYRVQVRSNPPVEGTIDRPVYDMGIVLALIRRGLLPPGRKKMHVLDLAGGGTKERTFTMRPREDGRWEFTRGEHLLVRSAAGDLIETVDKGRPRWTKRRSTADKAPDVSLKDESWKGADGDNSVDGSTVRVLDPGAPWVLRRLEDSHGTFVGLEHPLQIVVVAMEFNAVMGVVDSERLSLAANIRDSLNKVPTLPQLGAPALITWRERPAIRYPLAGTVNHEPVVGDAHLYRSRSGQAVIVMAFYPVDLRAACDPLANKGLEHVRLDAVETREIPWRRVKPSKGGLTLKVPGGWLRAGMANKWVSTGRMSSISVNQGKLPPAVDIPTAQKLWVSKLHQRKNLKDVKILSAGEVEIDGRTLHRTVVSATVTIPRQPDLAMTATSVALLHPDQTYTEITAMAFNKDWDPEAIPRVFKSVRWEAQPLSPDGR